MPRLLSLRSALLLACCASASLISPAICAADQHQHADAKEVAALHATLAPLWHAPAGKARIEAACAKAALMDQQAQAIKGTNAAALQEVTSLFKEKCATSQEDAEAVFGKLHEAFHKVSEHKE